MADVLFISMPFGTVLGPSIGLSLLKGALARSGIHSKIDYFSIRFAELLGWHFYRDIAANRSVSIQELAGEWIFRPALFATTPAEDERYVRDILIRRAACAETAPRIEAAVIRRLRRARSHVERFLDWCLERVLDDEPRVVGFTSNFQQHVASLALARRIKDSRPGVAIVFGGPNCGGVAGVETLRRFPFVDAVVSGEGDVVVPELIARLLDRRPADGLPGVRTRPELERQPPLWPDAPIVDDLDSLPIPDYSEFFRQFRSSRFGRTWIPNIFVETSRGCWWGQKMHCTFCGLNGPSVRFRSKSPRRALDEIALLTRTHRGSDVQVIDNILDLKYFDELMPELAKLRPKVDLLYETKSNLRKEQVRKLRRAGVVRIQPGIESFSDSVLRLMRKGVTGLQNIQVLKWCKELGVHPYWNVIWGFPGEDAEEYRRMADLVPLIVHLTPPDSFGQLRLDRHSPNFERAAEVGFIDLHPLASCRYIYPFDEESLRNLSHSFSYSYKDGRSPAVYTDGLRRRLEWWQSVSGDSDLFSVDLGEVLVICDLRPRSRRFLNVLSGVDRELYLAADEITTASTLSRSAFESAEQVTRRLDRMVSRGLMLREAHRYLALAIPVGEYQPGAESRARFRRAMRRIGKRVPGGTRIELSESIPVPRCRAIVRKRCSSKRIDASLFVVQNERTLLVRDCV